MNELIGPLGLPGAAAAALACIWFGIGIRDKLTRKAEPNSSGDWRSNTTAAVTALTSATAHLTQALRDIGGDVADVKARSTVAELRLGSLATREDLNMVAEKNRHAQRGELVKLYEQLDDLKVLLQQHDAWERGRAGAGGATP